MKEPWVTEAGQSKTIKITNQTDADCLLRRQRDRPLGILAAGYQHAYREVLRRLLRSVREKRRELWGANSWLLHHDNAPAHNALSIRQFLAERNVTVLAQPPYSPDLAPCDFFLFPKLKEVIKGVRFPDVDDIRRAVTTELQQIPEESFQGCMLAWQQRMQKCMRLQGDYFEGQNL